MNVSGTTIENVKADILESIKEILDERVPDLSPTWNEPYANYSPKEDSLYLSLTEEDEFCQHLPWDKFVETVKNNDPEVIKAFIPRLGIFG